MTAPATLPRLSDADLSDRIQLTRSVVECVFLAAGTFEVVEELDAVQFVLNLAELAMVECQDELRGRIGESIAAAHGRTHATTGPRLSDDRLLSRMEKAHHFIECVEMAMKPMINHGARPLVCTIGEAYRPLDDCMGELQARQALRAAA